ncbi:hypothetical protein MKK55_11430 [Methylobacterium sp. J-059]|uniref:hypothetical protein n=1 Tax=Methylobacterium sp. J-059 TaxID=2836643 RepID=UPI001FB9CA48|nr:hypothetical protein [Methylobacterium sp. J-059]MCJ2039547.1 hypothetical protein [Methylobacterium sp. J-059]
MPERSAAGISGFDTSMYATKPPETPNMLTQLSGLASVQNAMTQGQLGQTELTSRRLSLLHNELSSLYTHDNPTMADVNAVGDRLVANGFPQELVAREVQAMQAAGGSPQAIKATAARHISAALDAGQRFQAGTGTMQTRDVGGQLQTVVENPMRGTVEPARGGAAAMDKGMTPGDANTIQPMVDSSGRVVNRTKQQNVDIVTGRAGLNNAFKGRGAQAAPAAAPGGGVEAPGPNFEPGLKALNEDKQGSTTKLDAVRPLTQAIPLIQGLTNSAAGPGSQAFSQIKSRLITLGIVPANATDVVARQEVQKYLNAYVAKSGIAQRSDMGTTVAQSSSPNLDVSLPATLELARNAVAADRLEASRPLSFKGKPDDYIDHKARYGQQQDIRAYGIDMMKPADRNALLKDMLAKKDTPEGKRFFDSLNNAHGAIYSAGGQN